MLKKINYLVVLGTPATNVGMLDDLLIPPFLLEVIWVNIMQMGLICVIRSYLKFNSEFKIN